MESSARRAEEERRRQEGISKQIADLQAQLKTTSTDLRLTVAPETIPTLPKRKQPDSILLVPPTPSPKKRKLDHKPTTTKPTNSSSSRYVSNPLSLFTKKMSEALPPPKPAASNVLNNLARLTHQGKEASHVPTVSRSSGFADKPPPTDQNEDEDVFGGYSAAKRDERLALIEDLEPGPVDHTPPSDDPNFERLEPNSGIRLLSRTVPHEDLQDHLRGRFYLAPSRLYSAIRLLPDKQGYDVPVPGDWITIAVVAERGLLKYSRAPVAVTREDDGTEKKASWKGKNKEESSKPTGKKYVNLKLIDFGARSRSGSSATGGKAVIRGDAFLSLLLFESDGFDLVQEDGDRKPRKVYKGGSRGAFESMAKLKEGDVIALLNPRILKPYQRSNDSPHPTNNILALTPESASSIMWIGRAQDLGMCSVRRKNDQVCGSWYDKRVADVCEYHVQHAVERRRAARPEFSIGTTGMSSSSAPKRKPAYDPARQWGLKPADTRSADTGATYIMSGHIVGGGSSQDSRSLYAAENIGREGQAKAKRMSSKDADRALKNLLARDKEGMRAVMKAREVGICTDEERRVSTKGKGKGKEREKERVKETNKGDDLDVEPCRAGTGKSAYSAEVIKQLGFDPITRAGQRRGGGDSDMQKKLESLAALQSARKEIALGPRPGPKIRSGVMAPACTADSKVAGALKTGSLRDIDGSDDELPANPSDQKNEGMIDLDDF
ncbi:DNA replication licensing factor mcm10 [Hypsizygus marmoreus]|uniref:DNA replication licensing factor mcm10 n=1 Tax=Hypsizygus marmoreus TaxID=39966 RepID=A0A369JND9_HYPMA|nr:DNA replication licensing factor mcm10 [Hypsizygus marmoreus]